MRAKTRHPVKRIRAAIAGADLFFPGKTKAQKRRKVVKFLRRTKSNPRITRRLEREGKAGAVKPSFFLGRKHYFVNTNRENANTVLHEMAHFYRVGTNNIVTANAISGYLHRLSGEFADFKPTERYYLRALASVKHLLKIMGNPSWGGSIEHPTKKREGLSPTILVFGSFAADKEREWKKPASGLFLIMEICNGVPIRDAIKKIESGKLDSQIAAFAKKHHKNLLASK
ncbi:MAG: hypothetical protein PHD95_07170 [Candidatus ainarchaeum sp.]|nr:hypothetical protein [Candidatus ainarchaeum sp.]